MSGQHLLGEFQSSNGLFAAYAWEMTEEFVQSISGFEVIQERFYWNASANEDRRTAQNIRVTMDNTSFIRHVQAPSVFQSITCS